MSQEAVCPDAEIEAVAAQLRDDEDRAMPRLDGLIADYPSDARLHFLKGSVLAGNGRIDDGHAAMVKAVELAPGYHVARLQLGLLELSSGDAAAAEATWDPLRDLPDDNFLRLFVNGLRHLIRDEFVECRALLLRGMALNDELPEMNGDMRLILDEMPEAARDEGEAAETSETHLLLQRYTNGDTRH